ncbi:MAG: glycosyltransferase [Opitutaceae bacterium]|nr:glycosyltransferase [Opitutaceae bacterium]
MRQLAALFSWSGNPVHLVGFGDQGTREIAGLDARVATTTLPNRVTWFQRQVLGALGQNGSFSARRALVRFVRGLLTTGQPGARGLLLYNQDPWLSMRLADVCKAARIPFLQQYAELHVAQDFRARWLQGYFLREQMHMRLAPRRADGNLVISSWLRDRVELEGGRNILRLPAFVDVDFWDAAIGLAPNRRVPGRIVYVGEGARRDCLETIIAAAALSRKWSPKIELRLVGLSGKRGRALRNHEGVITMPRLNHAELACEYSAAAATILLRSDDQSSRACFPTRLGEMLLGGAPVILSDMPDYNLEFVHGLNAYLVNPSDLQGIARCMVAATSGDEENDRIGAAGRLVARTRLNPKCHLAAVAQWLDRACGKP